MTSSVLRPIIEFGNNFHPVYMQHLDVSRADEILQVQMTQACWSRSVYSTWIPIAREALQVVVGLQSVLTR
ncbi:hypothetical protein LCGC14_0850390 [marine sediment metagenome]|uniref:Uncharacterized protein n=1 Tax=marine sediment metagenome TaxID=412755 RepID=A0A0F9PFB4_9ZZZZ